MKVSGVNLMTSAAHRLRVLDFDVETAQTVKNVKFMRNLRTRTATFKSYANMTKVDAEFELTYTILKELLSKICSSYDAVNEVFVPPDTHDLAGNEIIFIYKVFDNDNVYTTTNGYIDKLQISGNALSIPKAQLTSYHSGIVETSGTFEEDTPELFLKPADFAFKYALYDVNDNLGTFTDLATFGIELSIKQNLKSVIGKDGTVSKIYSEQLDVELVLTVETNNNLRDAFLNNQEVSISITVNSDSNQITIAFPRLVMYNYEETKEFGLVQIKFKPNAIQNVPIQFSYV